VGGTEVQLDPVVVERLFEHLIGIIYRVAAGKVGRGLLDRGNVV